MDKKKEAFETWDSNLKNGGGLTAADVYNIFSAGWDAKLDEALMKIMVRSHNEIHVERVSNNVIYLREENINAVEEEKVEISKED